MQFHANQSFSTATEETVIAAPEAASRIRILGLHLSVAGATKVTLGFGSDNQRVWDFVENQSVDIGVLDWEGDPATALSVTNGSVVEIDVTVDYTIEVAP